MWSLRRVIPERPWVISGRKRSISHVPYIKLVPESTFQIAIPRNVVKVAAFVRV